MNLKVHSIFTSISGEVGLFPQGSTCVFIRLAGCNLRCVYCDSPHTQSSDSGNQSTVEIVKVILNTGIKQVLITGGEPLLQMKALKELVDYLNANGLIVQIETNGTIKPEFEVDCWVVDFKLPGSGVDTTSLKISNYFDSDDYVKFVCHKKVDLGIALDVIESIRKKPEPLRPKMALSTTGNSLSPNQLYKEMRKLHLSDILLNVQIHKLIGLD